MSWQVDLPSLSFFFFSVHANALYPAYAYAYAAMGTERRHSVPL